jgi:hypothetical protein
MLSTIVATEIDTGTCIAGHRANVDSGAMELPKTVEECHEVIQQLRDENAALRQSGASFGRLAERLNSELQEERRKARDRRAVRRGEERRAEVTSGRQDNLNR